MTSINKKSFNDADEYKIPPKAHEFTLRLGEMTASSTIIELGWKWSECIKLAFGCAGYQAD